MPSGKCTFNKQWLSKYKWLRETKHRNFGYCVCCRKDINVAAMGESALKSHAKCSRHMRSWTGITNFNIQGLLTGVKPEATVNGETVRSEETVSDSLEILPPPQTGSATCSKPMQQFVSSNDVLRAEILWTLKTVVNHSSYNSNDKISELFAVMFPDSTIARKFTCGERKTSYLCVFGIAEYFRTKLLNEVKAPFVICFDESLNKKLQEKQMDIHVRHWDNGQVTTRYLGSQFLGHATADDMVRHFQREVLDQLQASGMIQISMDGPSVNFKFHGIIADQIRRDYGHSLLNAGSCGLHTMHNAFKAGAQLSEWDISSVLSSLWHLLKDAPARREDYQQCGSSLMPLKFVNHRWLENVPVCKRALLIWEFVTKYVEKAESKQVTKPDCKSFETVRCAVKDKLSVAKIEFFCAIAGVLQPFLTNYQTDRPMMPFLAADLHDVIRCLMRKFVKPEVLDEANSVEKLLKLDLKDTNIHLGYKKIEVGLNTEEKLKGVNVSDRNMMEFRMQCKKFLIGILKKLAEKCPLKYSLVKNISSLNPKYMACDKTGCREKFKRVVRLFIESKHISGDDGDIVMQQYDQFLDDIPAIGSDKFVNFAQYKDRLDEFFLMHMADPKFNKLLIVVKMVLVLSHGQATVERGFSVNKELECENLHRKSVVAQRVICDYVRHAGGVLKVPITNQLMVSASAARSRYEQYLEKEREQKKD